MAAAAAPSTSFVGTRQLGRSSFCPQHASQALQLRSHGVPTSTTRQKLVVEAKRRRSMADGYGRQGQQQMMTPRLEADDGDPKFVIFIKTQNVNIWYPLSMVSGGTTAKMMVNAMKWDLGKSLYEGTLTRNLGSVIYKDEKAIRQTAIKQFPMLKGASGFEYGYKLVDPKNPKASVSGSGVIKIPPQEALKSVADKAKEWVGGLTKSLGLSGSAEGPTEEAKK